MQYKEYNKKYKSLIKRTKLEFNLRLIKKHENNPKETWNIINKSLGKSKIKRVIQMHDINGKTVNRETAANILTLEIPSGQK